MVANGVAIACVIGMTADIRFSRDIRIACECRSPHRLYLDDDARGCVHCLYSSQRRRCGAAFCGLGLEPMHSTRAGHGAHCRLLADWCTRCAMELYYVRTDDHGRIIIRTTSVRYVVVQYVLRYIVALLSLMGVCVSRCGVRCVRAHRAVSETHWPHGRNRLLACLPFAAVAIGRD